MVQIFTPQKACKLHHLPHDFWYLMKIDALFIDQKAKSKESDHRLLQNNELMLTLIVFIDVYDVRVINYEKVVSLIVEIFCDLALQYTARLCVN